MATPRSLLPRRSVIGRSRIRHRGRGGRWWRLAWFLGRSVTLGGSRQRRVGDRIGVRHIVGWLCVGLGGDSCDGVRALQSLENLREQHVRLLAAMRRRLAVLVLVLGVADDAAGLLDVIVDHRHDGVIRNAALTRTVVVQHVARPKPALLHALPRKQTSDHDSDPVQEGNRAPFRCLSTLLLRRNLEFSG